MVYMIVTNENVTIVNTEVMSYPMYIKKKQKYKQKHGNL